MSEQRSVPVSTARAIPKHRVWLFAPIKSIVLDIGKAFDQLGEVLEVTGLPARVFVVRHPDHVGRVLKHPEVGNRKYTRMLPRVKWVMGQGSYILEGDQQWRGRRKLVQQAFRVPALQSYVEPLSARVAELLEQWGGFTDQGQEFDVWPGLQRLITRVNFEMFFSHHLKEPELTQIAEDTHFVQLNFVRLSPLILPLPSNLHFRQSVSRLRKKLTSLIVARRNNPAERQDLLAVLLASQRELEWTDEDLVGEIFSVYFGAAVMATTLAWALYLLGANPEQQQKLIDEAARELGGRPVGPEDIPRLSMTRAAILETTRLFPPSWGYPRHCLNGMTLGDYELPRNSMVVPMVYFTHRHEDFWDNPDVFQIERFLDDNAQTIHPYSHLPFGTGPRICLGAQLAPMVLTLILASIFQKISLEFRPRFSGDPVSDFGFEIHPADQIRMRAVRITENR